MIILLLLFLLLPPSCAGAVLFPVVGPVGERTSVAPTKLPKKLLGRGKIKSVLGKLIGEEFKICFPSGPFLERFGVESDNEGGWGRNGLSDPLLVLNVLSTRDGGKAVSRQGVDRARVFAVANVLLTREIWGRRKPFHSEE